MPLTDIFHKEYWEQHEPLRHYLAEEFARLHIHIETQGRHIMSLLDDIKAKQAQTLTELAADDDLISSLTGALQSKDAAIADLNTKLAAAIANNDQAGLQEVSDAMDGLVSESTQQNAKLVAAVQANTTPPVVTPPGTVVPPVIVPPAPTNGPTIASISPTSGAAGDQITISGTNLGGAEAVNFGDVAVPPTAMAVSADGTTATATVPPGSGSAAVTVTTAAGVSNSVPFTYGASSGNLPPPAAPTPGV